MEFVTIVTLITIALNICLLTFTRINADVVHLLTLVILTSTGILTVSEAYDGFTTSAALTLALLTVIVKVIQNMGAMDYIMALVCGKKVPSTPRVVLRLMSTASVMSTVISNTVVATVFFDPVSQWARKHGIAPSRLILPICYAIAVGSCCTIIGTGNNLLISDMYHELTDKSIGFFEPFAAGVVLTLVGITYIMLINRLFPDNAPADDAEEMVVKTPKTMSADAANVPDRKKFIALALLLTIIVGSCLGLFSIINGCSVGIILLAAMRCMGNKEAWSYIPWSQLLLFADFNAIANCIDRSELDTMAADLVLGICGGSDLLMPIMLIVGLSLLLKVVISSYAIVAILVPVSVTTASMLGCSVMPFLMGIMFSTAFGFTTPYIGAMESMALSYGNYTLKDMARFGIPFTLIMYATTIATCMLFYTR